MLCVYSDYLIHFKMDPFRNKSTETAPVLLSVPSATKYKIFSFVIVQPMLLSCFCKSSHLFTHSSRPISNKYLRI